MTEKLISIKHERDIPKRYQKTPIAKLLQYHNLRAPLDNYENAELLILMCMDNRLMLRLPRKFSFVIRNSGAVLKDAFFSISFAIAVGEIQHIVVIGHSDCTMVDLESKKEAYIKGLSERCGWKRDEAETYFLNMFPYFTKTDAAGSASIDTKLTRYKFPGVLVAPLFYSIEDNSLYLLEE